MTMLRARRLASTAVVAALALPGLAACQQSPDVAAYLGGATIKQDRVEQIYDEVRDDMTAAQAAAREQADAAAAETGASPQPAAPVQLPIKRQDVLNTLLTLDVLKRAAAAHGLAAADAPTAEQIAQEAGLSPEWEYTELYAETLRLRSALRTAVQPATLTDADLRDVYERLIGDGAAGQVPSFEEFRTTLSPENKTLLETYVALREELETIAADQKIKLNPRYGDQQVTLLSANTEGGGEVPLVAVTFAGAADEDPYVTDVSEVATVS